MQEDNANGKKAVHVKWTGKTIALGTFPSEEADEKCARAKALTRAWRSTMRPKPTREWVMAELERLGVRIVSGKLGRKPDYEQDSELAESSVSKRKPTAVRPKEDREITMTAQERVVQQQRDAGISMGMNNGSIGGIQPASSGQQVNQHYEMLKLHHMNLLQELHETTMMMNMYQQQQFQATQADNILRRGSLGLGIYSGGQRGSLGLGSFNTRGSLGLGSSLGAAFGQRGSLGLGSSLGGLHSSLQLGGHKDDDSEARKRDSIGNSIESAKRFKTDISGDF